MTTVRTRSDLNPVQRAAVEHLHGPLLVVAGAGTGKTRVITERVAYLLEILPQLAGENILAVTYTEKAATEMAQRIRRRTDKRGEAVQVSTFHAFCHWLLCQHNQELAVLDDVDTWIFLRRRLDQLGLELYKNLAEPGRFLSDFQRFFSRCQDELVSPADYERYADALASAFEQEQALLSADERDVRQQEVERERELARVYANAERLLAEANRVTFGGLLFRTVALLRAQPELLAHYQERFRYILVDEFQDANIAQIELLARLADRHRNLTAVGDDDQAIYRFRGASYASFRKFTELYPDARIISLTQNYRSTRRILRVATQLIAQNGAARFRPDKQLLPVKPAGEKVRILEAETPEHEADLVREEIERLHRESGRYAGLAALYRTHRHRRALVEALTRAGIPFVIRRLSILDNTLVRDLLAYLRVVARPEDNVNFARLLGMPAWRVAPEHLCELAARAQHENQTLAQVAEALHPSVRAEHTNLEGLLTLLRALRERAGSLPVTQLCEELLARLDLRLLPADPDRIYLEELTDFLDTWEKEKSQTRRLPELIEYLDFFEEAGGSIYLREDRHAGDAVQLMTVHAAKGLEFDTVFVLRLTQNDFPVRRRRALFVFPDALMKEALPPGDFHVQEERRLCYVALTRAQNRLRLLCVEDDRRRASVFLEDILRDPRILSAVEQLSPLAPEPAASAAAPVASAAPQQLLFAPGQEPRCYSRIVAWPGAAPPPLLPEPLSLNHSALETYETCPLKFLYAHRWQLPGAPKPAMVFGSIMHRVVAQFFQARRRAPDLPFAELQHLYEQQWRQTHWPFRDAYQQQEYQQAGLKQLEGFYERHRTLRPVVLEQEKTFRWPWEDVVLTGRIDQINRLDGRRVEIVEYKTGRPPTRKTVERSPQLALYAAAAEAVLELVPARLTLYNLTTNEPISIEADGKQRAAALERVRQTAARVRAGEFPARPGYHCRFCDYQRICPEYEQPLAPVLRGENAGEDLRGNGGGEKN